MAAALQTAALMVQRMEAVEALRASDTFVDVELRGGLGEDSRPSPPVKAHQMILASRSKVLKDLFDSAKCKCGHEECFAKCPSMSIILEGYGFETVSSLVSLIYTGDCTLSDANALAQLVNSLQVDILITPKSGGETDEGQAKDVDEGNQGKDVADEEQANGGDEGMEVEKEEGLKISGKPSGRRSLKSSKKIQDVPFKNGTRGKRGRSKRSLDIPDVEVVSANKVAVEVPADEVVVATPGRRREGPSMNCAEAEDVLIGAASRVRSSLPDAESEDRHPPMAATEAKDEAKTAKTPRKGRPSEAKAEEESSRPATKKTRVWRADDDDLPVDDDAPLAAYSNAKKRASKAERRKSSGEDKVPQREESGAAQSEGASVAEVANYYESNTAWCLICGAEFRADASGSQLFDFYLHVATKHYLSQIEGALGLDAASSTACPLCCIVSQPGKILEHLCVVHKIMDTFLTELESDEANKLKGADRVTKETAADGDVAICCETQFDRIEIRNHMVDHFRGFLSGSTYYSESGMCLLCRRDKFEGSDESEETDGRARHIAFDHDKLVDFVPKKLEKFFT